MKLKLLIVIFVVALLGGGWWWNNWQDLQPDTRSGFPTMVQRQVNQAKVEIALDTYAEGLGNPRDLIRDPAGNLLVSIPARGQVVALPDNNQDGKADQVITVVGNLNRPHGLAFKCEGTGSSCKIFVAETDQVTAFGYDQQNMKASNKQKLVDLPGGGNHFTRSLLLIRENDQDKLLISVGSDCNVCRETDWRRAKILSVNLDGSNLEEYATGLRNSVFMAIHPVTGKVWATEMGRDRLGDDIPPDEINIIEKGRNYGWPVCYGKNIHDTNFDKNTYVRAVCTEPYEYPSYIDIQAHSAPLGLAFIPDEGWPEDWKHDLLVAYHGSWNRSVPTGYKVVRYKLDDQGNYLGEEDFLDGWLDDRGRVSGRPVDVLAEPGGIAFISDDKEGIVYRAVVTGRE